MRAVKAAAVQLSPVLYSREGTVDKIVRKIDELGQQGVQFATFPETVVPYYPQAQADDGLARPLQPARVTESPDRSYAHRARSRTRCASKATR